MSSDSPTVPFLALYIISMHIIQSNQRTSTHWKLSGGRVIEASSALVSDSSEDASDLNPGLDSNNVGLAAVTSESDPLLSILTNKVTFDGGWKLDGEQACRNCNRQRAQETKKGPVKKSAHSWRSSVSASGQESSNESRKLASHSTKSSSTNNQSTSNKTQPQSAKNSTSTKSDILDCGAGVNSTQYDHLRGIASRFDHPHIPEPEVAMIFRKKGSRNSEVDMTELEKRLRKSLRERPKSPQVYNQIGNFWRIKGNTQISIECFRKALYLTPNHPDVLLNLARVLFNLQFLDDAIFLTRRSLEMQPPDQNAWLQHFTLGEILKSYGHYAEATHHFRHTLELKSGFQPAQAHLREMEVSPDGAVTYYTLFIILFLVMCVLCGFLTTVEADLESYGEIMKTQRHFNRAMAMRSMKLGMNPRLMRLKKNQQQQQQQQF